MPDLHFEPELLVQFSEKLAQYDPVDLLATIGGLQLRPENADRAIRLEVFAHVVASLEDNEPNRPHASRNRLSQWCNTGVLGQGWVAAQEDPLDNPFLEAFPFYNGNFLVFPGIADESTFILHLLSEALFAEPGTFSDPLFVREARELLSAVLALSNEVAERAGLVRGVELPPWVEGQVVFIPDARTLAALKQAVSFHPSEVTHLLEDHLASPAALDQITLPLGHRALAEYELETGALRSLSKRYSRLLVQLSLSAPDQWFLTSAPEKLSTEHPFSLQVDADIGILHLTIAVSAKELIERADNSGERDIMRVILQGVRELLPEEARVAFSDEVIITILDRHAPLGRKKQLLSLSVNQNPDLDVRGLLPFRKVQRADLQELLDELADELTFVEHLSPGPIPEQEKPALLDKAADFFYRELVQLVDSLDAEGLLEFLIRFQEAIVRQTSFHRLSIPARLESFRSVPQMVKRLVGEGPELATAAMASRFVIEYVAACPPPGERKMSLSAYDRLQALAAHIIHFGVARDLLTLQVADMGLDILPSGRLAVNREQYDRALASYLPVVTAREFSDAIRDFGQHWQKVKGAAHDAELWARIDAATAKEFGCSMTDLQTLLATAWIISEDLDPGVVSLPLDAFLDRLAAGLGWPREHIQRALELLSLVPRQEFLVPSAPYKQAEVYPWRFNRQLSYLRRPFVWRERNGAVEVLWGNRHLYRSVFYLNDLCFSGRLSAQARTPEMQRLMSQFLNQRGEAFNDKVADFLTQHAEPGVIVKRQVKAIGELRRQKGPPGDIDVLVIDPGKRRIWVIECKDFATAHMPHQIANELEHLFLGKGGKKSKVERRAAWVREHLDAVLEWYKVKRTGGWKVEPLIVVSQELFTPYLRRSPIRILSFDALMREQYAR